MRFSLRKDKDVCYFSFFNNSFIFFMINVYSDDNHLALKYLKDTEVNFQNVLIIAGNFNIRDSNWNLCYPFHLIYSDSLLEITDSYGFCLFSHNQQIPTRYSNNINNKNDFHQIMLYQQSTSLLIKSLSKRNVELLSKIVKKKRKLHCQPH